MVRINKIDLEKLKEENRELRENKDEQYLKIRGLFIDNSNLRSQIETNELLIVFLLKTIFEFHKKDNLDYGFKSSFNINMETNIDKFYVYIAVAEKDKTRFIQFTLNRKYWDEIDLTIKAPWMDINDVICSNQRINSEILKLLLA